jgi:hypothetical protein
VSKVVERRGEEEMDLVEGILLRTKRQEITTNDAKVQGDNWIEI